MSKNGNYIRFDWAMKHTLRDKANFDILEGFISVLLNDDVKIVEILESESNQDDESDKFNRVDIKAKNSKGHIILVEVQLTSQLHYLQRILYGTCKTITEHMKLGNKYDQVKKVYSISILYCEFGEGDDYIYKGETTFEGLHTKSQLKIKARENGVIVTHLPREVFPEYFLIRVNSFDKVPENFLDEWMDYLQNGTVQDETKAPGLLQVKEKLKVLSMTPEEKQAYDIHIDNVMQQNDMYDTAIEKGLAQGLSQGLAQGLEQGRAEGIRQGRAEGLEEGKNNQNKIIAHKMLENGLSPLQIKQITGLNESEY